MSWKLTQVKQKLTWLTFVRSEEDNPLGPVPLNISLHGYPLWGISKHLLLLRRILISKWGLRPNIRVQAFAPPQKPLKILIFPSCPRRKNIILICKVKNHKDIQTYARGKVNFIILLLFLTLRNLRNVIKYFGRRYVPSIQRWSSNPTVQISL